MVPVKIKKTDKLPFKKFNTDFAYDLYAKGYEIKKTNYGTYQVIYHTGIQTAIPVSYGIKIAPRSSISETRLRLVNPEGIIDSPYRGEWLVIFDIIGNLSKTSKEKLDKGELIKGMYEVNDRIAQCYILKRENIRWKEVEKLDNTDRNKGGFGSTGK